MRTIKYIIIHCSATKVSQNFSVDDIDRIHREKGYTKGIGYHYYITKDGTISPGRPEFVVGAHCKGWNAHSIGICYEGGLDEHGCPADTRTEAQKASIIALLRSLLKDYPEAVILGHRDTGAHKECPCFNAAEEYKFLSA